MNFHGRGLPGSRLHGQSVFRFRVEECIGGGKTELRYYGGEFKYSGASYNMAENDALRHFEELMYQECARSA